MKEMIPIRQSILLWVFLLLVTAMPAQDATVSGTIRSTDDPFLMLSPGLLITDNPGNQLVADLHLISGQYAVPLPTGGNYTLTPYDNYSPLNGVTTFDRALIMRHILGIQPFTSPYQYIAADVDSNGIIDTTDASEILQLISGIYTEFPNNSSWRFVPANYVFPDAQNPFPFPESITIGLLTGDLSAVDFIAVKIGDVNGTAVPGGNFLTSAITGSVRMDQNGNCLGDSTEASLSGWQVTARSGNVHYFATTQDDGSYTIFAPSGTYDVWLNIPNLLWGTCLDTVFGIQLEASDTDTVPLTANAEEYCSLLEVDLSTPLLRRCFGNTYNIQYCNRGTATAEDARIEVTFDPFLTVTGSSAPWTSVNGNTYTFEPGDVPAGYGDNIQVSVEVSCEATLGQTHCSTAHIFPDTLCSTLAWNSGELEITGACQGDNVIFTVTNHGAPMTQAVDYVVIEDVMVQMTSNGSIQLGAGQSQIITVPANGSTWRLEVDQPEGYPWNTLTSAAVEGCGENGQGVFSLGYIVPFPNNDESPFEDEDCQENRGSFDPNDKQGFPRGVHAQHFVRKDQELDYLIRFQNTGTDTAFTVMVLDTLSSYLDPATIRPLGSSHPYTWQVLGEGVLQMVFPHILLPDSNVNEAASHGYVKFLISPRKDLPDGTVVENQAAIFFDFNLPIITNRTWHTLGEHFLNVSNVTFRPGISLDIWPNPTSSAATFFLKSVSVLKGRLRVFDSIGHEVSIQDFTENKFDWNAAGFAPGMYYFRLEGEDGVLIGAGNVSVVR